MTDHNWRQLAACRDHDPDLWFPSSGETMKRDAAMAICHACPVIEACRASAIANAEPFGVWGAQTDVARAAVTGRRAGRSRENNRALQPHGTPARAKAHYRAGEKPCPACLEAANWAKVQRRAAR